MKANSNDYSAIKWINNNVPKNATILSGLRSISLYKNKTIPYENISLNYGVRDKYINSLKLHKPQFFITKSNNLENFYLKGCIGDLYKTNKGITIASRNPFTKKNKKFNIYVYHFNYENLNFCVNIKQ